MYIKKVPLVLRCGINLFNEVLAGKWKTMIVYYISIGNLRPTELLQLMTDVDRRVLMQQLQELITGGIVKKIVLSNKPLVVNYLLTEMGQELLPVIGLMEQWSERHRVELERYVNLKISEVNYPELTFEDLKWQEGGKE